MAILRGKRRAQRTGVVLRRSPFVIAYWQNGQLLFENYLTRRKIAASAETAAFLDFFSKWKREAAMLRRWPDYTPESLRKVTNRLVRESFLERSGPKHPPENAKHKALGAWRAWNPAAGFFHMSTKDIYTEEVTPEEARYVEALARAHPVPQPLKRYPGARVIRLSKGSYSGEFPGVLQERRTWREFSQGKVDSEVFGRLLHLSFGVQNWERIPKIGRLAQKTSPSGGALHPSEAYVFVRRVKGVGPGIYHYDAGGHRLQDLRRSASAAELQKCLAGQWWFRDAAFVVFLTAIFGRTQWKYDYARAYRAILIEAGHLCQTFCLTATWLGLAPFCTIALADSKIEKRLGIDGISESVIYAMGAGVKPEKK
jgi:SagB-type dehydrogenase family enzyme